MPDRPQPEKLIAAFVPGRRAARWVLRALSLAPLAFAEVGPVLAERHSFEAAWLPYGQVALLLIALYLTWFPFYFRRTLVHQSQRSEVHRLENLMRLLPFLGASCYLSIACMSLTLVSVGLPLWQHYSACAYSIVGVNVWLARLKRHPLSAA